MKLTGEKGIRSIRKRKKLTVQGTELLLRSSGHVGTIPSLTGALRGQARPNILVLTARGLSVSPNCRKLAGILDLVVVMSLGSGL